MGRRPVVVVSHNAFNQVEAWRSTSSDNYFSSLSHAGHNSLLAAGDDDG